MKIGAITLALTLSLTSLVAADVVPPSPCPEPTTWRGGHDGECVPCPEGTEWRRRENNPEYGECVGEPTAMTTGMESETTGTEEGGGCSTTDARGAAWLALLLITLGARRRARPIG